MQAVNFQSAFDIIYEDNHILAVSKKSGILVQGDETGDKPLNEWAKDYLKAKYVKTGNVFCGVVHRIDRPVSGLVILAKTSKALERMNELFREHTIQKTYLAIVNRRPKLDQDTLVHWLKKNSMKKFTIAFGTEVEGSQRSELSFSLLGELDQTYLLKVLPITGRFHQIRAQLAKIGSSIVGDVKYRAPLPCNDASICLHAYQIRFIHPVSKELIELTAPIPQNKYWNDFGKFL